MPDVPLPNPLQSINTMTRGRKDREKRGRAGTDEEDGVLEFERRVLMPQYPGEDQWVHEGPVEKDFEEMIV